MAVGGTAPKVRLSVLADSLSPRTTIPVAPLRVDPLDQHPPRHPGVGEGHDAADAPASPPQDEEALTRFEGGDHAGADHPDPEQTASLS